MNNMSRIYKGAAAATLIISALLLSPAYGQQAKPSAQGQKGQLTMERREGSAITTRLTSNIILNEGSTLRREWYFVSDPAAPAKVDPETSGINVVYESGRVSGDYMYASQHTIEATEPIAAFELRIQVLDVFGRHLKTLSSTEVTDMTGKRSFSGKWRIYGEAEAASAYTAVAYIANARTASGKVYTINQSALLEQIRKVASRITEADLEPPKPQPK